MIERTLYLGRWEIEFYFAEERYNADLILDRLFDLGASGKLMHRVLDLMESGEKNTGFTFSNAEDYVALIAIGPTDSSKEFVNTLVHELHHLAVAIASNLGVDLEGEEPAYIVGDAAFELADLICRMGCSSCR